jgi:ShK domain-like
MTRQKSSTSYSILFALQCFVICYLFSTCTVLVAGKKNAVSDCFASNTDFKSFQCYPSRAFIEDISDDEEEEEDDDDELFLSCSNSDERCEEWAEKQECKKNPNYMLVNCRKSCGTCVSGHAGVTQIIPEIQLHQAAMRRLLQTARYMYDLTSRNYNAHKWCFNSDPMCTYFALLGKCENEPEMMKQKCAATCQVCKA